MSKRTRANKARAVAKIGATVDTTGLTNLEVIGRILSGATGKPAAHWRNVVVSSLAAYGVDIATTKLLDTVPPHEAHILLTKLGAEQKGVLCWIVEGVAKAAQANPNDIHRLSTYLHNQQN